MPFGLRNAPATFQRFIDRFRNGLGDVRLLAYLDDMILLSTSFEDHLDELGRVFNRLRQFRFRLNRSKCHFCCQRLRYLRHLLTPEGIRPDPAKIETIQKLPPPKNLKHLLSFVQTCSWYRRFIPQFAEIARPLTELTKKNVSWTWANDQETAYRQLKAAITSEPILRQADLTQPFILRTDASSYALGAVLLQGEPPQERPVEYISRLLTPAERNYTTTEREALAIVWSVNKFRGYIEESSVVIITDHQALKWLMTLKSPSGRLARWALQLQPYNLRIDYAPGKSNVVADMLSRPPCNEETVSNCGLCVVSVDMPARTPSTIRREQLRDPDLQKILNAFSSVGNEEEVSRWTSRGYMMTQGVLYRYDQDQDADNA